MKSYFIKRIFITESVKHIDDIIDSLKFGFGLETLIESNKNQEYTLLIIGNKSNLIRYIESTNDECSDLEIKNILPFPKNI